MGYEKDTDIFIDVSSSFGDAIGEAFRGEQQQDEEYQDSIEKQLKDIRKDVISNVYQKQKTNQKKRKERETDERKRNQRKAPDLEIWIGRNESFGKDGKNEAGSGRAKIQNRADEKDFGIERAGKLQAASDREISFNGDGRGNSGSKGKTGSYKEIFMEGSRCESPDNEGRKADAGEIFTNSFSGAESEWSEYEAGDRSGKCFGSDSGRSEKWNRADQGLYGGASVGSGSGGYAPGSADDPGVRQAAQRTSVARMLGENNAGTGFFTDWFHDKRIRDEHRVEKSKHRTTLLTVSSILMADMIIVLLLMITSMTLMPIILGTFVTIDRVTANVTGIMTRFSDRDRVFMQGSLSQEEIDEIVAGSGAAGEQETVIRYALSKVGYPYSQTDRSAGRAYDCSSLAYFSWQAAGVDLSYGEGIVPTAALEASRLYAKGKVVSSTIISEDDLQPGDLIFYGGRDNGRFLGIYHVAVYVGNGEVVEALNEKYGVVYQTLRTKNLILVLRP